MAGSLNRRIGRGSSNADNDLDVTHDINVTPFIDVMLVLLIIFMVAAPLATADVKVDLPGSTAASAPRPDKPLYLTLGRDLDLSLGNGVIARDQLAVALDRETDGDRDKPVYLRADKSVDYAALMEVMNLLRAGGYLKIALVGQEVASAPKAVVGVR